MISNTQPTHIPDWQLESIHTLHTPAVYAALATRAAGLTSAEAEQRLVRFGRNNIQAVKGTPIIWRFLANFTHLMAILLWVGGVIAFIGQLPQLGVAIWMVNVINGAFSFWQEYRAEKAVAALRQMLPIHTQVLRDGTEQKIFAEELVPGDVLLLGEGDHISADARLIQAAELQVDQSTLSGESYPVVKTDHALEHEQQVRADMRNLIFAGTNVVAGTGKAVVFATGMNTEFGKIAHFTQSVSAELSPLQQEMARATKIITVLVICIGVFFFLVAISIANVALAEGFIFALGMIVAFVPEGMLPTVTLSLAIGVQRMAQRNALVKRLSAVETLGCTNVICTDKTGTLTANEMTVCNLWIEGTPLTITGVGYEPRGTLQAQGKPISTPVDGDLRQLLVAAALCTNARVLPPDNEHPLWTVLGDPTEAALRVVAQKSGIDLNMEQHHAPRLREIPFDSRRKRMTTIHRVHPSPTMPHRRVAYVKGAPKEILALCTHIRRDGSDLPLEAAQLGEIVSANDSFARQGLRVLAAAMRPLPDKLNDFSADAVEHELVFLGLIAMMDPPRPEVAEAVQKCHRAGIRITMITGDYGLTAESVARRIGIVTSSRARIVTGAELEAMSDETLCEIVRDEVIFARATPEHKLRIVGAYQANDAIVAVTGDGVNDAPALKKADIGIAMGRAGTDVAKEAASMILLDDNFASIVNAIEEGRAVFNNIRKFAVYVFNSNMAEAVPFILFLFSQGVIPLPLTVMQVLSIDLGTDMMPALGLGAEPLEAGLMNRPPRSRKEPLLKSSLLVRALLWYGMIESIASMSAYFFMNWLHGYPGVPLAADGTLVYRMATTMTFAGVVATQVGAVFCCRTERISLFRRGFFTNRLVLVGVAVELVLLCLLVYVPFLQHIFDTAPIDWRGWLYVFAWTPIIILLDEARKAVLRRREQRQSHPKAV